MSSFVESVVTNNYCGLAALTLILCEYLALFPREIKLFWRKNVTGASVLFLSNRYLSLLSFVIQVATMHPMSDQSCANIMNTSQAISMLPYFPWAVFSALRTYALCERGLRLPVAVFVFLLSSVSIGVNFARFRWLGSATDPKLGCLEQLSISKNLGKDFNIASRTCLIAADLCVLGVTWRATYRTVQMARIVGQESTFTFSGTLLRDGTTYFLVLATLNILHLLFTMLSIISGSLQSASLVTIFTAPITTVLISRFILDLQEVDQLAAPRLPDSSAGQTSMDFTRVIGSLGSSLPPPGDMSFESDRGGRVFSDDIAEATPDKETEPV